jgi:hypothetical protein
LGGKESGGLELFSAEVFDFGDDKFEAPSMILGPETSAMNVLGRTDRSTLTLEITEIYLF